ncbi:hypothetical protein SLE2022_074260 [Rubroshorea leprosula]
MLRNSLGQPNQSMPYFLVLSPSQPMPSLSDLEATRCRRHPNYSIIFSFSRIDIKEMHLYLYQLGRPSKRPLPETPIDYTSQLCLIRKSRISNNGSSIDLQQWTRWVPKIMPDIYILAISWDMLDKPPS